MRNVYNKLLKIFNIIVGIKWGGGGKNGEVSGMDGMAKMNRERERKKEQ